MDEFTISTLPMVNDVEVCGVLHTVQLQGKVLCSYTWEQNI